MEIEPKTLHVVFFPYMAPGHMIPTLDIAKVFAAHHVKTTIITTPLNASTFLKPLQSYKNIGPPIDIEVISFPKEAGLPKGVENLEHFSSDEMAIRFIKATEWLKEPLIQVLEKCDPKPNCLVADMLFHFANDVAFKFKIPRLVLQGSCCFALSAMDAFSKYEPHKSVSNDDEEFVIPHLPHEIKFTKTQLYKEIKENELISDWIEILGKTVESEIKSYGIIMNSFYELEQEYADYYRTTMGRKVWQIGPVSLCNQQKEAKFHRGKDSSVDEYECLKWLDSKKPMSVVYVCFGSLAEISSSQLLEIAKGLEDSEQDFIWAIRDDKNNKEKEWCLPKGFEERMVGKGLILRGWAPQVMILDHVAVGVFVTHCGWNSTLEGISYGVPMVTWPMFAEQFYNEKFVTEILKIGVAVGAKRRGRTVECSVRQEAIKEAIKRLIVGEGATKIRNRATMIKKMAKKAVNEGGSSYFELKSLLEGLINYNC